MTRFRPTIRHRDDNQNRPSLIRFTQVNHSIIILLNPESNYSFISSKNQL
ncbi:hypothetical protein Hanom_Chr14g01331141 [Helianthus anomalus]